MSLNLSTPGSPCRVDSKFGFLFNRGRRVSISDPVSSDDLRKRMHSKGQRRGSIAEDLLSSFNFSPSCSQSVSNRTSLDSNISSNLTDGSGDYKHRLSFSDKGSMSYVPKNKKVSLIKTAKRLLSSAFRRASNDQISEETQFEELKKSLILEPQSFPDNFHVNKELIGEGANGKVYKVKRVTDGKCFAIKEFCNLELKEEEKYHKFLKEAIIGSVVDHLNSRLVIDIVKCETHSALIMEYYPITLSKMVYEGRMNIRQLNHHYSELISAVKFLHDNGIAHRDVKLENLCLSKNGALKMIDFGNAVIFNTSNPVVFNEVCGTDQYLSPEMFSGTLNNPKATDIWALGILYLVMISKKLPWPLPCPRHRKFADFLRDRHLFLNLYTKWTEIHLPQKTILGLLDPNPQTRLTIDDLIDLNLSLDSLF